jgi:hypothetical protein
MTQGYKEYRIMIYKEFVKSNLHKKMIRKEKVRLIKIKK